MEQTSPRTSQRGSTVSPPGSHRPIERRTAVDLGTVVGMAAGFLGAAGATALQQAGEDTKLGSR